MLLHLGGHWLVNGRPGIVSFQVFYEGTTFFVSLVIQKLWGLFFVANKHGLPLSIFLMRGDRSPRPVWLHCLRLNRDQIPVESQASLLVRVLLHLALLLRRLFLPKRVWIAPDLLPPLLQRHVFALRSAAMFLHMTRSLQRAFNLLIRGKHLLWPIGQQGLSITSLAGQSLPTGCHVLRCFLVSVLTENGD